MRLPLALIAIVSTFLVACGGGGGGGGSVTPAVTTTSPPTSKPTPAPTAAAVSIPVGSSSTTAALGTVSGQSGSLGVPAASNGSGSVTAQLVASQPAGSPVLQSSARLPRAIGSSELTPILFVDFTPSATLTFGTTPSFAFAFPAGFALAAGSQAYVALYDPTQPALGWQTFLGPATVTGATATGIAISFGPVARSVTFQANQTYVFCLFATAATINPAPTPTSSPSPTATATAAPTSTPTPANLAQTGFACPTNDQAGAVARMGSGVESSTRRGVRRSGSIVAANLLAVTYDRSMAQAQRRTIAAHESALGTNLVADYDFPYTNTAVHVIAVPAGQLGTIAAQLRVLAGIRSVAQTGAHRYASTVTQPYFPNDPYFDGFTSLQNTTANNPAPSTYQVGPYEESASVPGQWDMHAIGLENAFGYSQYGGTFTNPLALGSSAVKIAIIDTGEDSTHPELSGKVVLKRCFITGPNNYQSTSNFSTDPDGHGTDVAGIAAASLGNGLGFVGVGGNVSIMAYRVFPTPDDNCAGNASTDLRCGASTNDIAMAIDDAVSNGASVISMSLGGGTCVNGVDDDPVEGAAVANAIAHNVIVVAAAGNESSSSLDAPACDSGVIAVGATSLDDGQAIGTNRTGHGTANAPVEYVASYSNYSGSQPNNPHSASAWGIVAPGGDPNTNNDNDDLHWIEHIWTSTPFMSSPNDQNFIGNCNPDYAATSGAADCRTLIAGTSMATPHVAGAAALILSVNPGYQSPSAMKTLLCQTAHDIGDPHEGCGRLNVYRAMAIALGDTSPPPL